MPRDGSDCVETAIIAKVKHNVSTSILILQPKTHLYTSMYYLFSDLGIYIRMG